MTIPHLPSTLFAQSVLLGAGNLGAAGRRHHYDGVDLGPLVAWLLIAAVTIAGVCGTIHVAGRILRHWRYNSPGSLFFGLCRVHRLKFGSRRLLKQIARLNRLSDPGRLFTEPGWLDPTRLRGPLRTRAAETDALRRRLFAE